MRRRPQLILIAILLSASISPGVDASQAPPNDAAAKPPRVKSLVFGRESLLLNEKVQSELQLSEAQLKSIQESFADAKSRMGDLLQKSTLKSVTQAERAKQWQMMKPQLDEIFAKGVSEARKALQPSQLDRLQQLQWQRDGVASIRTPEVIAKLGITHEQREKIRTIISDANAEQQKIPTAGFFQMPPDNRKNTAEKLASIRAKMIDDLMNVLSSVQQSQWEQLQGKRIDLGIKEW